MSDVVREVTELKREVVEARNQAIKTDNQVKNLSLDVKGFEKRFDTLEARTRLASMSVYVILALTITGAAYITYAVRSRAYEQDVATLRQSLHDEQEAAANRVEELRLKLAEGEKRRRLHDQAADLVDQMLTLLDNHSDREAGALLQQLDLTQLTLLERKLAEKRLTDLRRREAESALRLGRTALVQVRPENAVPELRRALALDPEGKQVPQARTLLGTALYGIKHYDEAEPIWRELMNAATVDKDAQEEARYYLGASLAHLGKRDESRSLFVPLADGQGRFAASAKAYLQALEAGEELPQDLPGGRVRVTRRPPTAPAPTAPAPTAPPAPAAGAGTVAPPPGPRAAVSDAPQR